LIAAGAFGLGLVVGWAAGFVGWSWAGLAYRFAAGAAVALSVARFGLTPLLLAVAATAIGAAAHETMLSAVRRRRRGT
jgi:hypothetical protein